MSELAVSVLLVAAGLAALYYGAGWLVGGSVRIARRLGVSGLAIGLTVVAYGTSAPELAVSVAAALTGHPALVLGNVVGSNIANIGLVGGLAALMLPLLVHRSAVRRETPIMILVAAALVALSADGSLSRAEGAALLAGSLAYTYAVYALARREKAPPPALAPEPEGEGEGKLLRPLLAVGGGVLLLFVGSSLTVDHAVVIARAVGVSERVIGLTLIAVGTSLPELVTSLVALRKGHREVSVGNIIGSNVYNVLTIAGVAAALAGLTVNPLIFSDYLVMMLLSLALLAMMRTRFVISRLEGAVLLGAYIAYLVSLFLLR